MVSHIIVHFTVTSGVDLVLILPFLLYFVIHVVLLPNIIFEHKRKGRGLNQNKVNPSLSFTQKLKTVKWSIQR